MGREGGRSLIAHRARNRMLPDDMLADVLGRLSPRSLAVSRCVCTAWRAVIDSRRLLRPDLLPLSLAGILVNYVSAVRWSFAKLFSRRPCCLPNQKTKLFPYTPLIVLEDHCNGLLLRRNRDDYGDVFNPATGWWMALPECPRPAQAGTEDFWQDMYLVYDPTVSSSSFEVFLIPRVPSDHSVRQRMDDYGKRILYRQEGLKIDDTALLGSQWPLSPCILNVFSSVTGRWEQRSFHRDGEGVGTVADIIMAHHRLNFFMRRHYKVYFRGALYVHCEYDFVMRISLSTNKYHMIKPPPTVICKFREFHLGKSDNGIYLALLGDEARLWVWILAETNGQQTEWILRHATRLLLPSLNCIQRFHGPWIVRHIIVGKDHDQKNALAEQHNDECQWNSDNDEAEEIIRLDNNQDNEGQTKRSSKCLEILAFHPFKEILFLYRPSMRRGLAYHLNSSKLEDLGDLYPNKPFVGKLGTCFPYTPCWI